ncbi:MAG: efflux RND transporter periplasmic adaptor subunit [Opitutaceae bacterium]|nr:efflux RND transporter periplasmic adaptor subunit [Opitutaceae bacterium]
MARSRSLTRYILLLVLVIGGAVYWRYFHTSEAAKPVFTTTTISQGEISQVVTATGSLEPVTSITVGSQVSGLVTEVLVDYNSPVKAGQLIAKIDPATYEQRLRQAEADLASSKASHTLTRLNTERVRELRKQNLVSQQELDQAEANLAQADAGLLTREASVENAKVDLSRCSIYAPVDGIVLDRQVEVGRTVAASLNAPTLFVIAADLTQMQINAAIAEADIGSVADGQSVNFTVDAFPSRQFRGRVVQIRNAPKTESNVVTYQTIIKVRNDDQKLKPGMTANVSVVIASRPEALRVTNSALRVRIPESLLPPAQSNATPTGQPADPKEQFRQLARDAGFTPGSGPPSPEVRAKMAALAKERGIDLTAMRSSRSSDRASTAPAITTHPVYKLGGTNAQPAVVPVTVKIGITDGINSEVVEGLAAGDVLITSALIPNADTSGAATPSNNPFSGMRRRL